MSYIGKTPTVGNFIKLDAITTSATNSYTLQHNSVNFSPESANHMLVSLNGVIQAPNTSFSVSGSTITFLPSSGTLSSSDSIDFIMVYGNVLDVGVASTVADASVTKAKMNLISDSSSAGLTIKGDGGSENGTLQLNCSQNSHGIKLSSPAHSSGQSYELIFPTGNVTADKVLKVASVSGSGATGVGQLSFGDAGGTNTPYFHAYLSGSDQSLSDNTRTKAQFNTELFDSANAYDNSTNYRFTPQTAGKYFVYASIRADEDGGDLSKIQNQISKNGSTVTGIGETAIDFRTGGGTDTTVYSSGIVDMNGSSDYLEVFAQVDSVSGNSTELKNSGTYFGAYKIIE